MARDSLESAISELSKIHVLIIGLEPAQLAPIEDLLSHCQTHYLAAEPKILTRPIEPHPSIVLCGEGRKKVSMGELAQLTRLLYQDLPIFALLGDRESFERSPLIKEGFSDAFLLSFDHETLRTALKAELSRLTLGAVHSFQPVKVLDLEPGRVLNFDTWLFFPVNTKYVRYTQAGDSLDQERVDKLVANEIGSLFVEKNQIQAFFKYTTERLTQGENAQRTMHHGLVVVTERKQALQSGVRGLISKALQASAGGDVAMGRAITDECRTIANELVLGSKVSEWYLPLMSWAGEKPDHYRHAMNVALYSTLFAQRLGFENLEAVAMSGILHDLGQAQSMPGDETNTRHPDFALQLLRMAKVEIPALVSRTISQHQERFNGSGYPRSLKGSAICLEAQLLGLMDEIDYLLSTREGQSMRSARQILIGIHDEITSSPNDLRFNPKLVESVLELFPI